MKNYKFNIIVYTFFLVLFTTLAVNIESPIKNFVIENDWIGFYGSLFGGIAGGFFALLIAKNQVEIERTKSMNELKKFYNFLKTDIWMMKR